MEEKRVSPVSHACRRNIGDEGEEAACRYLRSKGYGILYRNFKGRHGEIDIIAVKDEYLIFAEVKTRTASPASSAYGSPGAAVTREKQRHIIAAAEEFLLKEPSASAGVRFMRFDVLEVVRSRASLPGPAGLSFISSVHHIEGAFRK